MVGFESSTVKVSSASKSASLHVFSMIFFLSSPARNVKGVPLKFSPWKSSSSLGPGAGPCVQLLSFMVPPKAPPAASPSAVVHSTVIEEEYIEDKDTINL